MIEPSPGSFELANSSSSGRKSSVCLGIRNSRNAPVVGELADALPSGG